MGVKSVAAAVASGTVVPGRGPDQLNVSVFCESHGVSRKTFYKWVARFNEGGWDALDDRPRRPASCPHQVTIEMENRLVRVRKELIEEGLDHGPVSIRHRIDALCVDETVTVPSVATIWRVLHRRGMITPQPRKRPRSSYVRFEAPAPNETWQIDHTDFETSTEGVVKIFNIVDDHSRVAIRCRAVREATTTQAWKTFIEGTELWGLPSGVLSDNGLCFSGKLRHIEVHFESQLRDLGIEPKVGRPYHPQTTGKVERFQQTLKKWLRKQPTPGDITELQQHLDRFTHIYNHQRPHQGIGGITPHQRWTATPPAAPPTEPLPHPQHNPDAAHQGTVTNGCVTIKNYIIHIGSEYNGLQATATLQGDRANVIIDNHIIRHLTINPNHRYQPSGRPRGGTRKPRLRSTNRHPSTATHL